MQWSGKEMKALGRVIVPVSTVTLLNPFGEAENSLHTSPAVRQELCAYSPYGM